jgi:hypothetical protein
MGQSRTSQPVPTGLTRREREKAYLHDGDSVLFCLATSHGLSRRLMTIPKLEGRLPPATGKSGSRTGIFSCDTIPVQPFSFAFGRLLLRLSRWRRDRRWCLRNRWLQETSFDAIVVSRSVPLHALSVVVLRITACGRAVHVTRPSVACAAVQTAGIVVGKA